MSYGTCHTLLPVFLLSSWFFLDRLTPFCCTESEDSSDLNSENLFQQQPVLILSLRVSLMFDVLHTVINSVYVQTLPTEQATSVLTDSCFAGS